MAGKDVAAYSAALAADGTTDGNLQVASSVGAKVGAIGWLVDNNSPPLKIKVIAVPDATHVKVRAIPDQLGYGSGSMAGQISETRQLGAFAPNYGSVNCAAYTVAQSARIELEPQFIYDEPR